MDWVPGVDGSRWPSPPPSSITVQKVGDATAALFAMHEGSKIVSGPIRGNGFAVSGRTLVVAGGVGLPPLSLITAGQADTVFLRHERPENPFLG